MQLLKINKTFLFLVLKKKLKIKFSAVFIFFIFLLNDKSFVLLEKLCLKCILKNVIKITS